MINNIRFKIIARKINKIPEFYRIFARKMPDYTIRQRDRASRLGRGQMFVAEGKKFGLAATLAGLEDMSVINLGGGW